jgi:hypothetical protein
MTASSGRTGGRIGGGTRARTALATVPRVRVVGPAAQAAPAAETGPAGLDLAAAAVVRATVAGLGAMMRLSDADQRLASIAAAAAVAAMQAAQMQLPAPAPTAAPAPSSSTAAGKRPVGRALALAGPPSARAPVPRPLGPACPAAPVTLSGNQRGTAVVVVPAAKYLAGAKDGYDWKDVCRVGKLIMDKKISKSDLDQKDANGKPKYGVPRTSMTQWLKDDADVMEGHGLRGVKGKPHWLVERDVRNRTALAKAGAPTVSAGPAPAHLPAHRAHALSHTASTHTSRIARTSPAQHPLLLS